MSDATTHWWNYLSAQRWYGGKGRAASVTGIVPLDWYTLPGAVPAVRSEIAEVSDEDGTMTPYHLVVAYYPAQQPGPAASLVGRWDVEGRGHVEVHDAAKDPRAMRAVTAALATQQDGDHVRCRLTPGYTLDAGLSPKVYTGEQSNTNVLLGHAAILKVFRKLEPGVNLDIEVHEALGRQHVSSAARLYGSMQARWRGAEGSTDASLAMLVELLRDAEDGWELATQACAAEQEFTEHAAALGAALKSVHESLERAFPTGTVHGDDVAAAMAGRLESAQGFAPQLAELAPQLAHTFASLRGRELSAQRVHGDFHLGQTLHTTDGWKIIDFEGEPMKTMAERRAPDSPWRDVAGMLRSFDYARSGHADPGGEAALAWARACRETFLQAYGGVPARVAPVLTAYEIDKAVYEVVYEARNRPSWLHIPLAGLANAVEK